jgi:hypothetical protein
MHRHAYGDTPTIQRSSQRTFLAIAPALMQRAMSLWLQDVAQAYTQSEADLQRTILAKLLGHLKDAYPEGTIMVVVKPLYGIAEAVLILASRGCVVPPECE